MSAIRTLGPLTVIALQDAEGPHFDRREDALPDATRGAVGGGRRAG